MKIAFTPDPDSCRIERYGKTHNGSIADLVLRRETRTSRSLMFGFEIPAQADADGVCPNYTMIYLDPQDQCQIMSHCGHSREILTPMVENDLGRKIAICLNDSFKGNIEKQLTFDWVSGTKRLPAGIDLNGTGYLNTHWSIQSTREGIVFKAQRGSKSQIVGRITPAWVLELYRLHEPTAEALGIQTHQQGYMYCV